MTCVCMNVKVCVCVCVCVTWEIRNKKKTGWGTVLRKALAFEGVTKNDVCSGVRRMQDFRLQDAQK